jgi:uncharacterized protein
MKTVQYWVDQLDLLAHPEGGFYKETYRSSENVINRNGVERSASTGIHFLITSENFSAFHKIESDEMWHFHAGSALSVYIIDEKGDLSILKIGKNIEKGEQLQGVVPAGSWFASRVDEDDSYSLVGCTVSPGFDFQDFKLADRVELIKKYPAQKNIIKELTRG